jgi:protein-tyrosine-phosphatase
MARHAAQHGYVLDAHHTRGPRDLPLAESDLIIVMEPQHLRRVEALAPSRAQLTLLGLWHNSPRPYICDPYNADEHYRENCTRFLIEATLRMIEQSRRARL